MTKIKQKTHRFNKPSITSFLAISAFLLALVALNGVKWNYDNMLADSERGARSDFDAAIRAGRLEFCYNNNIKPCDDIAIKEHNENTDNKDNTFFVR